jgi:iron complex outermembrane receptor protein
MNALSKAALISAVSLLPFSANVYAAEAPPSNGEIVIVRAQAKGKVRSGTKTDTPIIEAPQTISVITREEMDVRAVATVNDALAYSAGVQSESSGIDSRVDEITVRGFGAGGFSSNNTFIDGLRLPSGGQWTRTSFDPFGLEQVEVLKGPSSVLYGQASPGGVINMVSKLPRNKNSGEIGISAAGYTDLNRWQYQIAGDANFVLNEEGTLLFRIVALARDGETQIKETSNSRYYIAPSLTWKITDKDKLTLIATYQRDEGGSTYQFLPMTGTLLPSNGRRIELDAYLGEPDWNVFERNQKLLASFYEHKFNDNWLFRNNMRLTHLDTLYRVTVLSGDTVTSCGTIAGCIPGQTIKRRAVQGIGESDGYSIDNQLQGKFSTGSIDHTILIGADYFHTEWEHYRDLVTASYVLPLLDFYNPVARGSSAYTANLNPQVYTETKSVQSGVYLQDQIELGKFRIALGGRYDNAKDDSYNPITKVTTITKADAFTGRVGGVYLFDNGFAPFLSYSESFMPSTGNYWDGTPFDPTTGQQWEGGIRYKPKNMNAYVTATYYQITQQNITTTDPDSTHICGTGTCSVQTGEGQIKGFEIEAKASLPFNLTGIFTFTTSDGTVTKTTTASQLGNSLPNLPSTMYSAFLDYRFHDNALEGVGIGGGVRYVGKSFGDTANTIYVPDYTLYDAFIRYDLSNLSPKMNGMTLSINARNLANTTYVATCGSVASCYYGSGRTVNLRLQYKW